MFARKRTLHRQRATRARKWATALAAAGTLVPASLLALSVATATDDVSGVAYSSIALFLGPSAGRWYVGDAGWHGIGARLGGFLVFAVGMGEIDSADRCAAGDQKSCEEGFGSNAGYWMATTGAASFVGSAIDDIATSAREVRRYNRAQIVGSHLPHRRQWGPWTRLGRSVLSLGSAVLASLCARPGLPNCKSSPFLSPGLR